MGPLVGATELSKALTEAGNNLLKPHSSTDALLTLLNEIESLLSSVEQDPITAVQNALIPSMDALISADFLRNPDSDVRVFVVSCLTEIMRITAPEAPYKDDQMKEIFQVTVEAFGKLADASCRSYKKALAVLDTVSRVRSSLVMLDLECDDLILEMFQQFLKIISPDHPQLVLVSMETIMNTVIDESEEVPMDLLEILLATVKKDSQDVSPMALKLVEKVLSTCACKLQPCIMEALKSTGTSLDMYSPVVLSICQSEAATTEAHIVVNPQETEVEGKISEEQVVQWDLLQGKFDLGISRKGNRSKRTARGGTSRANGEDKVRTARDYRLFMKQGGSESTDAETESGSTRRRGRKPNSLMNPEEGYSFKTSSTKKVQEKELGDSSLGKLAAKKASLPSKVGQTNQSVVISLSPSSKARTGSRKRSRSKMEETNLDVGSAAMPTSKKQTVKKGCPEEEDSLESNLEKPEDSIKTAKSSKKERAQNGVVKTSAKKPLAEVKTSGKKPVHTVAKKKNSEAASMDTPLAQLSKSKKKNSRATTPSAKESEQTPKSHPKRKRTAGKESNKSEVGEEMVGKKVNIWWPIDEKFYEGVVKSYSSRKKTHHVFYADGDSEKLNLKKELWEIIQDNSSTGEDSENDLPESTPLCDIIRRQKAKKRKNVELSSSPEARSSVRTMKKDSVSNSSKQGTRTKGALKAVSNEPASREGNNLKSLKGRSEKRQKMTRAAQGESEKDCDEKEEPEINGEKSLKSKKGSKAKPECKRDDQEPPEDQKAETETDGEVLKSNVKPKTDGEELKVAEEATAEPTTDGKEHKFVKETNVDPKTDEEELKPAEPTTDEEEHKLVKETNAEPEADEEQHKPLKEPVTEVQEPEPETDGEEEKSVKGPNAKPETEVQEQESAEEPTAGTKSTEEEGMSEEKRRESDRETSTNVSVAGKAENGAEDDDQGVTKEPREETDKEEVGTVLVSG
uniref:Sister chromatid cohesion protein PDS5-like protein A n=1 Tax=Noccaea caerulescens TaxID=107243 RepID=A0A1J3H7Y2_NOCCA